MIWHSGRWLKCLVLAYFFVLFLFFAPGCFVSFSPLLCLYLYVCVCSSVYRTQGAMCVAYTALLNGQQVVLKTPLPDTKHVEVAANDLEVRLQCVMYLMEGAAEAKPPFSPRPPISHSCRGTSASLCIACAERLMIGLVEKGTHGRRTAVV